MKNDRFQDGGESGANTILFNIKTDYFILKNTCELQNKKFNIRLTHLQKYVQFNIFSTGGLFIIHILIKGRW